MFMFSQPPPFRTSLTSISSRSHCSKWMTGEPGPRLFPEFLPVTESTEFGRSLPRRVASAMASRICCAIHISFAPIGTLISKVGRPVSWQIAPSQSAAWSMFSAMIVRACEAWVPGGSVPSAAFMAARTSGGRSVDVFVTSSRMLPKNAGNMAKGSINTPGVISEGNHSRSDF